MEYNRVVLATKIASASKLEGMAEELNKKSIKIYLDMDGVICDFKKKYADMGGDPKDLEGSSWKLDPKICNAHEFWEDMEWMPDGKELIEALRPFNPTLLTAGWEDRDCMEARSKWFNREIGYKSGVSGMIIDKNKSIYAPDGNILIDDYTKNTVPWDAAGGHAILHTSTKQTLSDLYDYLVSSVMDK